MSSLSSNWKTLSSKLYYTDSKVSKNSKTKKVTTKIKRVQFQSSKESIVEKTVNVSLDGSKTSPIQVALWNKENEIKQSDIVALNDTISLTPQGNDPRKKEPGKYLAIDCEFVGVGPEGKESALARVSIVNFYGHTIYDSFVRPREKVTDWRTWVSGVAPNHMKDAISFEQAQKETANLLKDRILVGHAVHHDLDSLFLSHPKSKLRDTSHHKPFRQIAMGKTPSLKKLSSHFLKIDIQGTAHSSVEDARATMLLFRLHRKEFEKNFRIQGRK